MDLASPARRARAPVRQKTTSKPVTPLQSVARRTRDVGAKAVRRSGSPTAAAVPAFKRKPARHIVHVAVQPTPREPEPTPAVADGAGEGSARGSGSGSGSNDATGPCSVDCGPGPVQVREPPGRHAEPPQIVAPVVIAGLRVLGETQIHPPDPVKTQMLRDGHARTVAGFKVCLAATGDVASVGLAKSSGYAAYDAVLTERLRGWRYRPYTVGGRDVPVCGMVTFVYTME